MFLKLSDPLPGWEVDEVILRTTIVFDSTDPRVELSNGGTVYVKKDKRKGGMLFVDNWEVQHMLVRFRLDRPIPNEAVSATLTCKIGERKDRLDITKDNQRNIIWEIVSDKYRDETYFTYDLQYQVVGRNVTDEPVRWGTEVPVKVDFPRSLSENSPLADVSPC